MDKLIFGKIYKVLATTYEWFDAKDSFKIKLWHEALKDIDEDLLTSTVLEWIKNEPKQPTIADLRMKSISKVCGFVSVEEAWEQASSGKSDSSVTEETKRARRFIGGCWAINHSTNAEFIRSQFIKAYNNEVQETIKKYNEPGNFISLSPTKLKQLGEENEKV